ncbi:acyltransferase family protein [Krasilnikoviella flava]|uniref:Peptidoglycan/LPS O-acetylase OafA/YrhL, contains acyltransferase and SGNH-hydrolase domains n=1 Tax=Krasilnikoviella flava TaxID=526729 RepID=A0A1T5IAF3_9MICO|nr:acyltransferase family protein [Krasilnikoviella flava]SKC36018.1 Peptidoglycan/LPS O-acetylase OafA/YrhL, contains acyltransferase and SGNH-hydrolase domains [Krasilnikoviella flava]
MPSSLRDAARPLERATPDGGTPDRGTPGRGSPRGFRPEVQALRALAVAMVVLFHLWPGRLPGGYVGVDVFFVISGFLITGHLLRETEATGRVRLARFWARRARRLLPAAYLVLAVTVVATVLVAPRSLWQQWFRETLGATLYVENWVLAADAVDYLAADADPSPVQHYWSLSTEEQFYLVWPLLALLAAVVATRRGASTRRTTAVLLAAATAGSFAYSLWLTSASPASAYFVTPARAWQFGAGALLALWLARPDRRPVRDGVRVAAGWAGLAALVACALVYDASTPFPGTAAVVPVLATVAVIAAGAPGGRLSPAPLYAWRPVSFTADVSYSLYLWHWPAIVLAPFVLGHEAGLVERLLLLAGVVLLSALSKRFVEDPARFSTRWDLHRTRRALGATVAGTAALSLVAGCALSVAQHRAAEQREVAARVVAERPACFGAEAMDGDRPCANPDLDDVAVPAPEAVADDVAGPGKCFVDVDESALADCSFGPVDDPDVPHVVLVGDSHARALMPAFLELVDQGRLSLSVQLKSSCAWSTGPVDSDDERARTCEQWKDRLEPWLEEQAPATDAVVTTGYLKYLSGDRTRQATDLAAAWRPVAERGVPVVALSDNPSHDDEPSQCLDQGLLARPDRCDVPQRQAFPDPQVFEDAADEVPGATFVDLTRFYCRDGSCPAVIGGVNVYRDEHHLTTTYTRTMTPYLERELRDAGVPV